MKNLITLLALFIISNTAYAQSYSPRVVLTDKAQTLTNKSFGDQQTFTQIATPAGNPGAGKDFLYFKNDDLLYKKSNAGVEAAVGTGTVTSVDLTAPGEFSVAGTPITTNGTIAVSKRNQNQNDVYAGPSSGGAGVPTFRPLVSGDLPVVSIAKGGTNGTTQTQGFDNLSPLTTKGDLIAHNGTNNVRVAAGGNGQVLTADNTQAAGVKWSGAGSGNVVSTASVGSVCAARIVGSTQAVDQGAQNCIASVTKNSTGSFNVVFQAGVFGAKPYCTVSIDNNGPGIGYGIIDTTQTWDATHFGYLTYNSPSGLSLTDENIIITCIGTN